MKTNATYLRISSNKIEVTSQEKPDRCHECDNIANRVYFLCERCQSEYDQALQAFSDSFIVVEFQDDNHKELFHIATQLRKDGLYPAPDGVKFEVKEIMGEGWVPTYSNPDNHNLEPSAEPIFVATLSLIDAKEKEQSGEPGNEPKKEEQLFTKEDLRTAFEAGESHYDFQNWFREI